MLSQFNIELQQEQLCHLLYDLDFMYRIGNKATNSVFVSLNRICKCSEMDVKVSFKMNVSFEVENPMRTNLAISSNLETSNMPTKQFLLTIKLIASTTSTSLRQTQFARNEYEQVCIKRPMPNLYPDEDNVQFSQNSQEFKQSKRVAEYEKIALEVIQKFKMFKICTICRLLYKDGREQVDCICPNCLYDRIFFLKDTQCVICSELVMNSDQTITLICGHAFHSNCILTNFIKVEKRECPICRIQDICI